MLAGDISILWADIFDALDIEMEKNTQIKGNRMHLLGSIEDGAAQLSCGGTHVHHTNVS